MPTITLASLEARPECFVFLHQGIQKYKLLLGKGLVTLESWIWKVLSERADHSGYESDRFRWAGAWRSVPPRGSPLLRAARRAHPAFSPPPAPGAGRAHAPCAPPPSPEAGLRSGRGAGPRRRGGRGGGGGTRGAAGGARAHCALRRRAAKPGRIPSPATPASPGRLGLGVPVVASSSSLPFPRQRLQAEFGARAPGWCTRVLSGCERVKGKKTTIRKGVKTAVSD